MPSPFPGMDPYLEHPAEWPDVHLQLITVLRELLNQQIMPKYFARIEERVYVTDEDDPGWELLVPDVRIRAQPSAGSTTPASGTDLRIAEPIVATTLLDLEIHEPLVRVYDRQDQTVVAVIELLSPANKKRGSRGMRRYREKRHEIMRSSSHLIEIDLLRAGTRHRFDQRLPPHEYLIHVSRVDLRPKGLLWPVKLTQPLPVIPIPLRPGDPDAKLDLQRVLDVAYDRASYGVMVDYSADPVPPLKPEQAEWANELLRAKGLR